MLAAVQMIVVSTLDGLTRSGYDETRNWISQLSLGANGWYGTVNLATCGLWVILCAVGLHRQADRRAVGLILWCGLCHKLIALTLGAAGIAAVARTGPRRAAWVVAAVMTVSFVAASVLVLLDAGSVLPGNPSGLLERVALFAGLGWIGLIGGRAAWDSSARRGVAGGVRGPALRIDAQR